jgi:cytochrome c-type biogenesis protein CcmH/NrfG
MNRNDASETEFNIAAEMQASHQLSTAISHYKIAVDLNPAESRYWIAFGACLSELHHWHEAVKALVRGIELRPHYGEVDARIMLANALYEAGRVREARQEWEIVSRMQPTYPSHEGPIEEARRRLAERRQR